MLIRLKQAISISYQQNNIKIGLHIFSIITCI